MKQLEQFFLLIDQCLNDTEFIRKHALSEKDFTRNRILTFRNTFWGLLAHTGASLQGEIPLLTRKFCGEIPPVSPQAFSKARNKMNYTSCKEIFEFSAKKLIFHKQYKGYFLAAVDASRTVSYTNALSSFAFRKSFNTVPISPKIAIPLSSMNSGEN